MTREEVKKSLDTALRAQLFTLELASGKLDKTPETAQTLMNIVQTIQLLEKVGTLNIG